MILADSSVLIEFQRLPSIRTRQIIASHGAAVCGVTVVELLTGARNPVERQKVTTLLSAFKRLSIDEPAWELAGDLAAGLRVRGTSLALADVVIAATAIHHGLPLWTRDPATTISPASRLSLPSRSSTKAPPDALAAGPGFATGPAAFGSCG